MTNSLHDLVVLSDSVSLYCGDCLTILPVACDIIITDQPYGTGWIRGGGKKAGEFKRRKEGAEWDVFNLAWMDAAPHRVAAFCPVQGVWEMCQRLPRPHVLKYRKTNPAPYGVPCEPIVSSHAMPAEWEKEAYNGDNSLHPCQKPVDLLAWLVNGLTVEGETVCDPFMGSGSMGVACIRTGRRFVGIERDPAHFATARARLENELRQGLLPLKHNKGSSGGPPYADSAGSVPLAWIREQAKRYDIPLKDCRTVDDCQYREMAWAFRFVAEKWLEEQEEPNT